MASVQKPSGSRPKNKNNFFIHRKWQIGILVLAAFMVYLPTLKYEYVNLDDTSLIVDKFKFNKEPANIPGLFRQQVFYVPGEYNMGCIGSTDPDKQNKMAGGYYRPLFSLSLMLDAQVSNSHMPPFYRFLNLVYHLISCVLLLLFLDLLAVAALPAFALTLLFTIHPLWGHAVVWIPGRNDILLAVFAIPCFMYFVKATNAPSVRNYGYHFLFFFLAMLTKETSVLLPVICLVYLLFFRKDKIIARQNLPYLIFYPAAAVVVYFLNVRTTGGMSGFSFKELMAMGYGYLYNIPVGLMQYFGKVILPLNLSVLPTIEDTNFILVAAAVILAGAAVVTSRKKDMRLVLFGLSWFVLFLLPSLFVAGKDMHEHRAYLPVAGLMLSAAGMIGSADINFRNNRIIMLFAGLIIMYVTEHTINLPLYKNRFSFWQNSLETANAGKAAYNSMSLGKLYEQIGQYDKAIEAYKTGLNRKPDQPMLYNNMGGAYIYKHMYPEAEAALKKELEMVPNNCCATFNLGLVYKFTGKIAPAIEMWKKTLVLNKDFANAYQQLAEYYKAVHDPINYMIYAGELKKRGLDAP